MRLFHSENIVTHQRVVIFVNDGIDRLDSITEDQFIEDLASKLEMDQGSSALTNEEIKKKVRDKVSDEERAKAKKEMYTLSIPDVEERVDYVRKIFEEVLEFKREIVTKPA